MSAQIDANATADAFGNGVTTVTNPNLTVGAGANRALVSQLTYDAAITSLTVTWDSGGTNQAVTAIVNALANNGVTRAILHGLVAPTSGNKSLVASWTTAADVYFNGTSYTAVDQTGGVTTFPHGANATGTGTTAQGVTVTSAVGNATVGIHGTGGAGNVNSVSGTQLFIDNSQVFQAGANRDVGAASVALTATYSTSTAWASAGTDILAAGGAGGPAVFQLNELKPRPFVPGFIR